MLSSVNNLFEKNPMLLKLSIAALAFIPLNFLLKLIKKKRKEKYWADLARKVVTERDKKIETFLHENKDKITEEEIDEIIRKDVTSLAELIKDQTISSEKAVLAYIIRAATIGRELNLISNINFDEALFKAREADETIRNTPRSMLPPLIGVPVSIKDLITVANVPSTMGMTSCHNLVRDFDSLIVSVLRQKGAIPFVISNVPQGVFSIESSNYLWGSSQNPWNRKKTAGGSSGGEGGLVASGCSPFGVGSDLGGSIRIPSSFCGVYGFKPTTSRISLKNITRLNTSLYSSIQCITTSLGPICKSANDLITITSNLFGNFHNDPYVDNTPYDLGYKISTIQKIKIGYLIDMPLADAAPIIRNKMEILNKNLTENGYEVVLFDFPRLKEFLEEAFTLTFNYGLIETILNNFKGEKVGPNFTNFLTINSMSLFKLKLYSKFLSLIGEKRVSYQFEKIKRLDKQGLIESQKKFEELKSQFIDYFISNGFDALITPVLPCPAFDIGQGANFMHFLFFTSVYNCADMPCASIPIALCDDTSYTDKHNDSYSKILKKSMEGSSGLPFGIQIGTLPKHDEKCLLLTKEIDRVFDFGNQHGHKVLDMVKNLHKNIK